MSAGFRWTVSSQPRVLVLNKPMAFEPAPAHRKNRWAVDSLDYSAREVISIASGRMEVEATIKFEKNAQGLVDMLRDAADGNVVTYYPDLSNGTGYALWLVSETTELAPQAGNWSLGNYEVRTRWRDASASGTSIAPLFERLLFRLDAGHFPLGYGMARSGTVGTYIDSDGVLKNAAANIARIEWVDLDGDGVRETPGLLLEQARTNLIFQSEDLGTTWNNARSSDSTNDTTAPDGQDTADTLIEDTTATSTHYVSQNIVKAGSNLTYAWSVFVKAKERSGVFMEFTNSSGTAGVRLEVPDIASAVPAAATFGSGFTAYDSGSVSLPNGWYRIWVVGNTDTDTIIRAVVGLHDGTTRNYTGDGSSGIYLWGAQLELGNDPSSYIPTTASSVTRNADNFNVPITPGVQTITGYYKFEERGTVGVVGSYTRTFSLGGASSGGIRVVLRRDQGTPAARYEVALFDGSTQIAFQESTAQPDYGDLVELVFQLDVEDNQLNLYWSIENGAVGSSVSSSGAFTEDLSGRSWSEDLVDLDPSSGGGYDLAISVKVAAGTKTMAEMRAL